MALIADACAKEDITNNHFFMWIDRDDILPRNVKACYDAATWKERVAHVEQNGLYSDKPSLFNKDMIDGKKVCVACKRVNHTATHVHQQNLVSVLSHLSRNALRLRNLYVIVAVNASSRAN